ncbi:MAG: CsgG/HfaB family protein [Spirochaetes bacterium]|nr:CsgG/HfaB family protein [Spirochaetota bacterium]
MKKLYLIFTLILLTVSGLQAEKLRIAILDLNNGSGINKEFAADTTDLIRVEMINVNRFTILERAQITKVLDEQGFQISGCTETSCAVQIGKLLSANKILIGKISTFGKIYSINIRVVDVENGIAEYAHSVKANSKEEIPEKVKDLVSRLSEKITGSGDDPDERYEETPRERLDISKEKYDKIISLGGSEEEFLEFKKAGCEDVKDYIQIKKLKGNLDEFILFRNRRIGTSGYIRALKNNIHTPGKYKIFLYPKLQEYDFFICRLAKDNNGIDRSKTGYGIHINRMNERNERLDMNWEYLDYKYRFFQFNQRISSPVSKLFSLRFNVETFAWDSFKDDYDVFHILLPLPPVGLQLKLATLKVIIFTADFMWRYNMWMNYPGPENKTYTKVDWNARRYKIDLSLKFNLPFKVFRSRLSHSYLSLFQIRYQRWNNYPGSELRKDTDFGHLTAGLVLGVNIFKN